MLISKLINKILRILYKDNRVNIWATVVVNFAFFPINVAINFPVLIYGPCRLKNLSGKIIYNGSIRKGILKIGISDPVRSWNSKSYISIAGKLYIGTNVVLRRGINLSISSNAILQLENNVSIGDNNTIICMKKIWIKEAVGIGNNTTIMDTDFHYILDMNMREIKPACLSIIIEENSWIGGGCTIKKGTQIPRGTIVAGPYSMLGKDYTDKIPEYSLIAGSPAKLLITNKRRVKNIHSEKFLNKYFSDNTTNYVLSDSVDMNKFCMPQ